MLLPVEAEPVIVRGFKCYVARFNFTSRITSPHNQSLKNWKGASEVGGNRRSARSVSTNEGLRIFNGTTLTLPENTALAEHITADD